MEQGGGIVIYPELSYRIVGIIFEVFNNLGYGYLEKYYQKALEVAFSQAGIGYKTQCPYKVMYKGEIIGKNFISFLIPRSSAAVGLVAVCYNGGIWKQSLRAIAVIKYDTI